MIEAMTQGTTGYIQKPICSEILESSLSEYLVADAKFSMA